MSNQITPNEVVVIQMALGAIIEDLEALPKGTLNKQAEKHQQDILVTAKAVLVKIAQVSGKLIKLDPYKEGDEKEFLNQSPESSVKITPWAPLDLFNENRDIIYNYFQFKEGCTVYPIDDRREYYWRIAGEMVVFSEDRETAVWALGEHYEEIILNHRFYKTNIYPGKDFTMIMVDTRTDGNKFLAIYDNAKKIMD